MLLAPCCFRPACLHPIGLRPFTPQHTCRTSSRPKLCSLPRLTLPYLAQHRLMVIFGFLAIYVILTSPLRQHINSLPAQPRVSSLDIPLITKGTAYRCLDIQSNRVSSHVTLSLMRPRSRSHHSLLLMPRILSSSWIKLTLCRLQSDPYSLCHPWRQLHCHVRPRQARRLLRRPSRPPWGCLLCWTPQPFQAPLH